MYGRIIGGTGWTLPEIDALTFEDVTDLFAEWNEDPPMAEIVKAWVGFERKTRTTDDAPAPMKELTLEEFERMKSNWAAGAAELNSRGVR